MFSDKKEIQDLKNKLHELSDIGTAGAVLAWDQEVNMPSRGMDTRAKQMATLAGIGHEKLIDSNMQKLIDSAQKVAVTDWDKALVREADRAYKRAVLVPTNLVQQMSQATSEAFGAWRVAKEKNDWKSFVPSLQKVINLRCQIATLLKKPGQSLYDVMLDEFEMGLDETMVEKVFGQLKPTLVRLARELAEKTKGAEVAVIPMEQDKQLELQMKVLGMMGYDLEAGRQDYSPHPFTITFGIHDVRITTWKHKDFRPGFFATIHEAGHALYEQGVDQALDRLYLGETGGLSGGTGLSMHESQSRMWENMVGRSSEFLQMFGLQEYTKAVNVVRPSLIRVEADEVTYGLHIIIRYEIERDLIAGKIEIEDLPEIWNKKYTEYLGVTPKSDSEGVLQDVHWAHGAIGYFPTYLLGTLMAAQLWGTISTKYSVLSTKIKDGDLKSLREWLRENIHKHGRVYPTNELFKRITGEALDSKFFLEYLENKFEKLYN